MTFSPPQFAALKVSSNNLDSEYSKSLGRYKIDANVPIISSQVPQNDLEVVLARIYLVVISTSDREDAKKALSKLSNELREVLKEKNAEKNRAGTLILIGALLHQYFSLITEYDEFNKSYTLGFFNLSHLRACKLFKSIRIALQLPEALPDDYRIKDLEFIDVTTIVTSLEAFREHMKASDSPGKLQPRFKTYPLYTDDKYQFESNLDKMIKSHTERGAIVLKQFKAINFIQSLSNRLDFELKQVEDALEKWGKVFAKTNPDFSTLEAEIIEDHLEKNIESELVRDKLIDVLYTPAIRGNLSTMNHATFLANMKRCNSEISSWTLFGGFSLLLDSKEIKDKLSLCLNQALGIEINPSIVTPVDKMKGIKFLKQYIEFDPSVPLSYDFFGGKNLFDKIIAENLLMLTKINKEQTEASKPLGI